MESFLTVSITIMLIILLVYGLGAIGAVVLGVFGFAGITAVEKLCIGLLLLILSPGNGAQVKKSG